MIFGKVDRTNRSDGTRGIFEGRAKSGTSCRDRRTDEGSCGGNERGNKEKLHGLDILEGENN